MNLWHNLSCGQKAVILVGISIWAIWYLSWLTSLASSCDPKNFSGSPSYVCLGHYIVPTIFFALFAGIPTLITFVGITVVSGKFKKTALKIPIYF